MSLSRDSAHSRRLLVEGWRFADRYEQGLRERGDLEDARPTKPPTHPDTKAFFAMTYSERCAHIDLIEERIAEEAERAKNES